ncbi:MFS general substrate transporter [Pseudovirgaria hyperparasitica]|uniref:MFS general substrate transporter n=1 Tax=Pseudovirgaria hyperparasitica TaxID=470096 RepID=A0A6A6W7T2_9PEZI|nr:MFS general substrate transporter [Pseudovirgaria hyperparasitica]KAF2758084.1 MFS general substrate transporter [Pseudovirgaria hyperparasitica]
MGLRRWVNRTVRGVRDPTRGNEGYSAEKQREWTLETIDSSGYQWWVVVVAGIGFLTDSYDIFALNVVTPMLGFVYWPEAGVMPPGYKTGMMCATLAGTMVGQIAFGVAADFLGRRKMYGLELIIVIVATILLAMSSRGAANSMAIEGWLLTWRFLMGLGIGADYPLSATITSEFAPRKHRARMMATVFFMQPIGQLLATVISLAAVTSWKGYITDNDIACRADGDCLRAIDKLWRLVVGLGAVPALIALAFRLTIPESPRYKMDIKKKFQKASDDTDNFYGREFDLEETVQLNTSEPYHEHAHEMHKVPDARASSIARGALTPSPMPSPGYGHSPSFAPPGSDTIGPEDDVLDIDHDTHYVDVVDIDHTPQERHSIGGHSDHLPNPLDDPPDASQEDLRNYFITQGNWIWLAGTSLSWLSLDFAFYGLGLSSPEILSHIWSPNKGRLPVYSTLKNNAIQYLVLVSIGATVGGAAMIKVTKYASPKVIQFWGFVVLAILFIVTGSVWETLLKDSGDKQSTGLYVLYVLCQLVFNLGPNVTTFIIPAEIFPTRYRATCHGLSAAAGKLGSWVAQLFLAFAPFMKNPESDLGHVLQVMAAFMGAGAVVTWFLVPETRDREGKSRTLEMLGLGREGLAAWRDEERRRAREAKAERDMGA